MSGDHRDEHSAQLDGALRFEQAQPSTMSYAPVPQPLKNYFHAESTRERNYGAQQRALYDGTPHSSVLYEPLAANGMGAVPPLPGNVESKPAEASSAKWKTIGTIVGIVVLLALGVALLFFFLRDDSDGDVVSNRQSLSYSTANVHSAVGDDNGAVVDEYDANAPRGSGANAMDTNDVPYDGPDPSTYFYMPTPLQTPERSGTPIEGTPIDDFEEAAAAAQAPYQHEPNEAASRRSLERSNKPPPASWFGADAPTRGASSEAMALDGELDNQQAIGNIYGGGRANNVLGGKGRAPFAQVNDDAARQIGWAEIGDNGAPERGDAGATLDANRLAGGSARSMSELYEANLGARSEYREGSSASTIVTPDQAAQQTIGHNPDRAAQFDEGRQRSKEITAESAAAIGSIYAKKRQAAAGLSLAAAAKQRDANDTNYEFFDEYSQQPVQQ